MHDRTFLGLVLLFEPTSVSEISTFFLTDVGSRAFFRRCRDSCRSVGEYDGCVV